MSGTYRASQPHKIQQPARPMAFDDLDIEENILLPYVGISTLNLMLANISEQLIEIPDIS